MKRRLFLLGHCGRSIHSSENLKKKGWWVDLGETRSSTLWFGVRSCSSKHLVSGVIVRSTTLVSESSELLLLVIPSPDRAFDEPPNMDRRRPQRRLAGVPSEPVESADPILRWDMRCS